MTHRGSESAAAQKKLPRPKSPVESQLGAVQLGLVRVQGVVILPKFPLLARASGCFGRVLRVRVDFPQRKVQVGELYLAIVLGEEVVQSTLGLLAKGALKIRELDDSDRSFGISF